MILLWGVPRDDPIQTVRDRLVRDGHPVFLLNQFEAGRSQIVFDDRDPALGTLMMSGRTVQLADISSVYLRPYSTARVLRAAGDCDQRLQANAYRFDAGMMLWTELTSALVVNRPSTSASNNSKPLQSVMIAEAGFDVPCTLLTSDPEEAAAFLARFPGAIYKSTGGVRSRVSVLNAEVIKRLEKAACPLQIQEYVDGIDFRAHVAGDSLFACAIQSSAIDYRYPATPSHNPVIRQVQLPAHIEDSCVRLAYRFGLVFCGIDLRRSENGRWVCFEVNPSPGYTYYERATGAPLSAALAGLLAGSGRPASAASD
jgi:hypothetical protein